MSAPNPTRRDAAVPRQATRRNLQRTRIALAVVLPYLVLLSSPRAAMQEHRTPITITATAEILAGTNVQLGAPPGIPLEFFVEIVPVGGVVTVALDADLSVTWDDTQIGVAQTFDAIMSLKPQPEGTGGYIDAEYAYQIQPVVEIDFDEVFHNNAAHWGAVEDSLQDYLITGIRRSQIAIPPSSVPDVVIDVRDSLNLAVDSLLLLGTALLSAEQLVDTLPLNFTYEPYPCVRVEITGNLFTYFQYDVKLTELCARYHPPSDDSPCWASTDPVNCLQSPTDAHTYNIPIPCDGAALYQAVFCPITAAGEANVSVRSELAMTTIQLVYTCDPPGPLVKGAVPPISSSATNDSTWLTESAIAFDGDTDDAMFNIPIPLDSVEIQIFDGATQLNPNDIVTDGGSYDIDWINLDSSLDQCCPGNEDVIFAYREIDEADPDSACSVVLDTLSTTGPYTWDTNITNIPCAPSGTQKFVILVEFRCPSTSALLYFARSDTLRYSK